MPITDSEWDDGALDNTNDEPETVPVGDRDTEAALVDDFLEENTGRAYTVREIMLGASFDEEEDRDTVRSAVSKASPRTHVTGQAGGAVDDPVGDLGASSTDIEEIQTALDDRVEEGSVVAKEIETDEGTETYYRRNTGNEQVDG